ncbi:MAG: hypothetical protein NWE81_03685 [Candidatus Bathyarchaeota archaeon]|jgi:hypothetical protein|nr:hypothetical protein [Candidatus Bathyarchaeota archaeon]
MTCYFRHLKQTLEKAGIEVTAENKREIDKAIHGIIGVRYRNCGNTWKEIKRQLAQDEEDFISKLKAITE